MTDQTIDWNGNTYSADPSDLTMGELETIAQRSDITGFSDLLGRVRSLDHIGWKALFWAQDRRRNPDLRWDGYDGPTVRVVLDATKSWTVDEEPGKAPTEADGSEPSPTSSDTPPPSSTS